MLGCGPVGKRCYAVALRVPTWWTIEGQPGAWIASPSGTAHFFTASKGLHGSTPKGRVYGMSECGQRRGKWGKHKRERKCRRCLYLLRMLPLRRAVACRR